MKVVTADFAGAAFPPGTKVSFLSPTGNTLTGTVHANYGMSRTGCWR